MAGFLFLFGFFCIIYFLGILFLAGYGTKFFVIWLFMGLGSIVFSILIKRGIWSEVIPTWFRRIFTILFCVGLAIVIIVEGCIISGFSKTAPNNVDYLVVLGAQMKKNGPSKALAHRLDKAIEYLQKNNDTIVIVSGGQGPDEHISEAQGMYDYMVAKGVSPERIILEDKSTSTFENLTFSAKYLNKETDSVAIVSNNFHVFRATKLAKKAGYQKVYGIAAKGEPFHMLNNMLREFFGVVKDTVVGNM